VVVRVVDPDKEVFGERREANVYDQYLED